MSCPILKQEAFDKVYSNIRLDAECRTPDIADIFFNVAAKTTCRVELCSQQELDLIW